MVTGEGISALGLSDWPRSQRVICQRKLPVSVRLLILVLPFGVSAGIYQTLFGLPKGGSDRCPAAGL